MSALFVIAVFVVWALGDLLADDYFPVRASRLRNQRKRDE